MKFLAALVLIILIAAGGFWIYAGRQPGPTIDISQPARWVGASTPVQVGVAAPKLKSVSVVFEQNGKQTTLYTITPATGASTGHGDVKQDAVGRETVTTTISRQTVPDLKTGAGKIIVTASAPVVRGLRTAQTIATKDVQVRLEKPTIAVLSTKHYINLGGSEMVVYRSTPADVESGVQVGDITYPGYPASGVHVDGVPPITDPALKVAFFALLYDQDLNTPMFAYAKDEAGNSARADFDHLTFPKPFKKSRIDLPDSFLNRVVPAILETTDEVKPEGDILQQFLVLNGDLRRKNAAKIASFAKQSSPDMLWNGVVFHPFTNNAVEAAFADQRTYIYHGKEVDQQVHLGFDLARVVHSPIVAANRGKVVYAAPLGIYGNCIIIDHGQGVQSLYGHLSSFAVKVGDTVEKEQQIGVSGQTGLAGGDHLHFTMLVGGHMVNPVEWWDAHWIQDRIVRKLRDATGS
ncbi:MAG TPA: M23 family metallopeptidase [Vicinamibacterales bacterium]|jgi:murein DD-endopeptidase MepM/ murein hydrolase activator NlpD|nr:M23 family metallopeptidase [Vicinamibacterales bacterium]